jgi:hypothetical protein
MITYPCAASAFEYGFLSLCIVCRGPSIITLLARSFSRPIFVVDLCVRGPIPIKCHWRGSRRDCWVALSRGEDKAVEGKDTEATQGKGGRKEGRIRWISERCVALVTYCASDFKIRARLGAARVTYSSAGGAERKAVGWRYSNLKQGLAKRSDPRDIKCLHMHILTVTD